MYNRPSFSQLLKNHDSKVFKCSIKISQHKALLLFGLIKKVNSMIDQKVETLEEKTKQKINKFARKINKNNQTCLSFIEPQTKDLV